MTTSKAQTPAERLTSPASTSYMWALLKAVQKDQNTLSSQQITDAHSTEIAAKMEGNIYESWNKTGTFFQHGILKGIPVPGSGGKLWYYAQMVAWEAEHGDSKGVTHYQELYNQASASAQANESQQDGAVQAAQGQTSSDASNLQMKVQMVQAINSIETALSGMLGRITA